MNGLSDDDRRDLLDANVSPAVVDFLDMAIQYHDLDPMHDVEFLYDGGWNVVGFKYFVNGRPVDVIVRASADGGDRAAR